MFTQRPPADHQRLVYFDCPSGAAAPAADVTGAALAGLLAIGATVDDPNTERDESSTSLPWMMGVGAALATASAIYGFVNTSSCGDAKAELARRAFAAETARRQRAELERLRARAQGCTRDTDCKGERICVQQACVDPPIRTPIAPPPAVLEGAPAEPQLPAQQFPGETAPAAPDQPAPVPAQPGAPPFPPVSVPPPAPNAPAPILP